MPGTLVHDALGTGAASNLLAGATLNAAGTTTSTVVEVNRPGECQARLTLGTVTGTTPTAQITVQSSDDITFASGVVTHGIFGPLTGTGAAQSNTARLIQTSIYKRYVRLSVTLGGTSPVYTGSTLFLEQEHYFQTPATDTAT